MIIVKGQDIKKHYRIKNGTCPYFETSAGLGLDLQKHFQPHPIFQ
ncbi:hypothetical protein LCGC14_0959130 [marine sediment metagenome]|uniref:Uncharacterized protein n=1 Tax=marine sediment metagenome TaxID=412755 RepID=A0A0F9QY95_9ZZZZ